MKFAFDNTKVAFAYRSTRELKRARWMFGLIARPWMVTLGSHLVNFALFFHLPINWALRPVFKYFCGGENIRLSDSTIEKLSQYSVRTVLDYSAEGQTGEAALDHTLKEVLATVAAGDGDPRHAFAVFKISGLSDNSLLEKVSACGAGNTDGGRGETASRCEIDCLSPDELLAWNRVRARVRAICEATAAAGGRVMIDAEETWLQEAIDGLAEEMMARFNADKAIVFTTVQMYRHDRLAYSEALINRAESSNYVVGLKIVRGAYMEKERERAKKLGLVDPIQKDKAASDRDFDAVVQLCLDRIEHAHLVCATHNEQSSRFLADEMARRGIKVDDPRVSFAQLLGMSDHISFNLAAEGHRVAKYVPYGPIRKAIPYLLRRAKENTSVGGQTSRELSLIRSELQRRSAL